MIPLRTDSPLRSTPYMNWVLIAVNVVVFLFQQAGPHSQYEAPWYQPFLLDPRAPRLVCYFTYAFLHAGILHIAGNMLFLFVFGNNVNDKMGHFGYLGFYLAGGVFAGVACVAGEHVPTLGASGAISAVVGAYLILFPRSNVTVLNIFIFIGWFEIASYWFIIVYFLYQDVLMPAIRPDNTAHVAHIGGTLFGVAVCFVLLWAQVLPRDQFDVVAMFKQWNRRRAYRDAVNSGWNPYLTPGPPPSRGAPAPGFEAGWMGPQPVQPPPDPRTARILDLRNAITDALGTHDLPRAAELYLQLKAIDPQQVLSRQAQLDVANQLAGQQLYPQAADAYELFLRHYPKFEQIEQVELMLGLIYARYLAQYERAKGCLVKALARLHGEREVAMARTELARIEPLLAGNVK
jgi:membrane associated rhomboid family serine protease